MLTILAIILIVALAIIVLLACLDGVLGIAAIQFGIGPYWTSITSTLHQTLDKPLAFAWFLLITIGVAYYAYKWTLPLHGKLNQYDLKKGRDLKTQEKHTAILAAILSMPAASVTYIAGGIACIWDGDWTQLAEAKQLPFKVAVILLASILPSLYTQLGNEKIRDNRRKQAQEQARKKPAQTPPPTPKPITMSIDNTGRTVIDTTIEEQQQ